MTLAETTRVLQLLAANYKDYELKVKDTSNSDTIIKLWQTMFADVPVKLVQCAVLEYINSNKFPPTIADIKDYIYKTTTGEVDVMTLWDEAYGMICSGLYMTQEDFDKHSDEVKRFFRSVKQVKELAKCDIDTVNTVTKGQFLKQIEIICKRKKENAMLPVFVKELAFELADKMSAEKVLTSGGGL